MKVKALKLLPALSATLGIGWIIFQANTGGENWLFNMVGAIPFGDKIGHFTVFAMLTGVMSVALDHKSITIGRWKISFAAFVVLLFAIIEETTQIWIPSRSFDLFDLVTSIFGVYVSVSVLTKLNKSLSQR